jgi:hypothetical protein
MSDYDDKGKDLKQSQERKKLDIHVIQIRHERNDGQLQTSSIPEKAAGGLMDCITM